MVRESKSMASNNLSSKRLGVLEVGFGNLPSLERVLSQINTKVEVVLSADEVLDVDYLIIPGVGSFSTAIQYLKSTNLDVAVLTRSTKLNLPTLGICLGAQVMMEIGYEGGKKSGLGIFRGSVESLSKVAGTNKSHTGWDEVLFSRDFLGVTKGSSVDVFFNHDYALVPADTNEIMGTCNFSNEFAVALQKSNTYAVQFHPEKSQDTGLVMLRNFLGIQNV